MKAVRLSIYQQTANYRIPNHYSVRLSYPLPPFSTVIGMIHTACGFKEYHAMDVSIQGSYASEHIDLNTGYSFNGGAFDETRHQLKIKGKEKDIGICRGLLRTHILNDVNLIIYIHPEKEEDIELIANALKDPDKFLSLGRHEDLVRIDYVDIVDMDHADEDLDYDFKEYAYVPAEEYEGEFAGTLYNLGKKFAYDKNGTRIWESKINAAYSNQVPLCIDNVFVDHKNKNIAIFS